MVRLCVEFFLVGCGQVMVDLISIFQGYYAHSEANVLLSTSEVTLRNMDN